MIPSMDLWLKEAKAQENAAKVLSGRLTEKVEKIREKAVYFAARLSAVAVAIPPVQTHSNPSRLPAMH